MMKKNVRKAMLAAVMVMIGGLSVSARKAEAETTTTLTINEDESGSRVMEVVLPKENKKQYLAGKNAGKFEKLIKKSCPKELDYKQEDYKGGYKFTLTLSFDSIEDYKDKIGGIYESFDADEDLTFTVGKEPFESGIEYYEAFDSGDLLQWMEDAVSESGIVWWWQISTMLNEDTQTLVYADEEYANDNFWSSAIKIDTLEECYLSAIHIYNNNVTSDKIDRTVAFKVDKDYESLSDGFKEYLESGVPEGVTGEWNSDDAYCTYYIVELGELEIAKVQDAMNSLLQTDQCKVAVSPADYSTDMFEIGYTVEDTVNTEAFYDTEEEESSWSSGPVVRYGYAAGLSISDDGTAAYGDGSTESISSASYSSFSDEVYDYFASSDTDTAFSSTVAMSLTPDAMEIRTELSANEDEMTRSIEYIYDEVPKADDLETICSRVKENNSGITAEVSKKGITLQVKGDDSDLEDFMADIVGLEEDEIKYSIDSSLFGAKKEFEYKEEMSVYGGVIDSDRIKSIVILPSGAKLEKDSRYEKYEADDRTYEQDTKDGEIKWKLEGQISTVLAIILIVAAVVVVFAVILVVVIIVKKKR